MNIAIFLLIAGSFVCIYPLVKGPTGMDRFLALVVLTLMCAGFIGVYAIVQESDFLVDFTLDTVILVFIGAIAVAKYMGGKELDD